MLKLERIHMRPLKSLQNTHLLEKNKFEYNKIDNVKMILKSTYIIILVIYAKMESDLHKINQLFN